MEGAESPAQALHEADGMAGKDQRKVMTAVGRELLGFIWAIGIKAEAILQTTNCGMRTKEQKQKPFQIGKKQKRFNQ